MECRAGPQPYQAFATRDAEEAQAFVAALGFQLDIRRRDANDVDMQRRGVFLPGFCLGTLGYGAVVKIRTTQDYQDYRFVAPFRGRLCAVIANDETAYRPGTAMLVSPTLDNFVRVDRDTASLNIILRGCELRRHLAALLGEPLQSPLEFAAREFARGLRAEPRTLRTSCYERTAAARLDLFGADHGAVVP